jgi:hypothetical protein
VALAFAIWIAIDGDAGLARGGAAGVAVAAAALVSLRRAGDVRLAAGVFGATAAVVALVAAVHGMTGVRADILAVSAAIGIAISAGVGFWAVAAADVAGVLALPSRAGFVAAVAVLVALAHADRRNVGPALLAAIAMGAAWLAGAPPAGAPFAHGAWRHASGFADSYHRIGVVGAVLFVALLVALLNELPRVLSPAVVAAAAGAAFAPLEATAPLWLLAGFAAGGPAYDRVMATGRERRLDQIERSLESQLRVFDKERRVLDAERRRLLELRKAFDDRANEISAHEAVGTGHDERRAKRVAEAMAFEQEVARREAALEAGTWAISQAHPQPPAAQPQPQAQPQPKAQPQTPAQPPRFRPAQPSPAQEPQARPGTEPASAPAPSPKPAEATPSAPPKPPATLKPAPRRWNLRALDALVASRIAEFPDRADEWHGYIGLLQEHAVNGMLPERFDPLVLEVFGPILPAQ